MNLLVLNAKSQRTKSEVGFKLSAFAYQGDVTQSAIGSIKKPSPGIGIFMAKNMSKHLSLRLNVDFASIKARDFDFGHPGWKNERLLKFRTSLFDLSGNIIYSFKDNYKFYKLGFYLFSGVGVSYINVKSDYTSLRESFYQTGEQWVIDGLKADSQKKIPNFLFNIPVGGGLKYQLDSSLSLFGELNYRFLFTDYFDGYHKVAHPNKDHYYSVTLGFTFAISR